MQTQKKSPGTESLRWSENKPERAAGGGEAHSQAASVARGQATAGQATVGQTTVGQTTVVQATAGPLLAQSIAPEMWQLTVGMAARPWLRRPTSQNLPASMPALPCTPASCYCTGWDTVGDGGSI